LTPHAKGPEKRDYVIEVWKVTLVNVSLTAVNSQEREFSPGIQILCSKWFNPVTYTGKCMELESAYM